MKLINLPRVFIYTDRKSLDDFLQNDDLNKELYKVYLRVKDHPYYFKFNAEKAFNEAYYIATMAMNEPHPELYVKDWLWRAKGDMGWRYAANLVMSMVYAILYLQKHKPEMIDIVLPMFDNLELGNEHFPAFKKMAEQESRRFISYLSLQPRPVDEIAFTAINMDNSLINWQNFTDNFSQDTIRELVPLFHTKEEQLKIIDLFEKRQAEEEYRLTHPQQFELPF